MFYETTVFHLFCLHIPLFSCIARESKRLQDAKKSLQKHQTVMIEPAVVSCMSEQSERERIRLTSIAGV